MSSVAQTIIRLFVVFFALCLIKTALPAPVKDLEWHCSTPMDIALLLDASNDSLYTYDKERWESTLDLSKKIVDRFDVSENGTHFAVMAFSTQPEMKMNFNTYKGTKLNGANIKRDIDGLKLENGYTFIDKALGAARKDIFTVKTGMRKDKRKVAFVLTDGIQTKDQGPYVRLEDASSRLQRKSVEVYSIGMGNDIDVLELLEIAEENVYTGRGVLRELNAFVEQVCKKSKSIN